MNYDANPVFDWIVAEEHRIERYIINRGGNALV